MLSMKMPVYGPLYLILLKYKPYAFSFKYDYILIVRLKTMLETHGIYYYSQKYVFTPSIGKGIKERLIFIFLDTV